MLKAIYIIFMFSIVITSTAIYCNNLVITTYKFSREAIKINFDKSPERVLSTNGATTELLLRLGLQNRMIGTCYLDNPLPDDLIEAYNSVPVISRYYPKKENVIALKPDMIYGWRTVFAPHELGEIDYWNKIGIKTITTRDSSITPQKVEHIIEDINDIGKIFNVEDKTSKLIEEIRNTINDINLMKQEKIGNSEKTKVMLLDYETNGSFLVWGEETTGGDIVNLLGAESSFKKTGEYSLEDIISANPDVIILYHMDHYRDSLDTRLSKLKEHTILKKMEVFKNNRVLPIPGADLYCPGVRVLRGIQAMIKAIYPEYFEENYN